MIFNRAIVAVAFLVAANTSLADGVMKGDAVAGEALVASCTACHGADGNSLAPTFPKLLDSERSDQQRLYVAAQLNFPAALSKTPAFVRTMYFFCKATLIAVFTASRESPVCRWIRV